MPKGVKQCEVNWRDGNFSCRLLSVANSHQRNVVGWMDRNAVLQRKGGKKESAGRKVAVARKCILVG